MTEPDPPQPARDDPGIRLSVLDAAAHAATKHLPASRSAVALYDQASRRVERMPEVPAPLRPAIAAVLAHAAERRRLSGLPGLLGEPHSTLALAVAVLGVS